MILNSPTIWFSNDPILRPGSHGAARVTSGGTRVSPEGGGLEIRVLTSERERLERTKGGFRDSIQMRTPQPMISPLSNRRQSGLRTHSAALAKQFPDPRGQFIGFPFRLVDRQPRAIPGRLCPAAPTYASLRTAVRS